jgi:hypothetical protein
VPDFQLADAEFDRQTTILEALVNAVEVAAGKSVDVQIDVAGQPLPTIPPGGKNTMAAAAVVLLAAHFEEYVRQQVEEYGKELAALYAKLPDEFVQKLLDVYWRAGSSRLSRVRPKLDPLWASNVEPILTGLIAYPVQGQTASFDPKLLCDHERNMRWDMVVELSARVGVKALSDKMFKSAPLKAQLGGPKKADFARALEARVSEFYELRNGIVHSISQNAGIGVGVFSDWAAFFRTLTTAYASSLAAGFAELEAKISPAVDAA